MQGPGCLLEGPLGWKASESHFLPPFSPVPPLPLPLRGPPGGTPPLKATSSATVFVNLLDLNDNDPTFQNCLLWPRCRRYPCRVSVYQVSFLSWPEILLSVISSLHLPTCQPGSSGCYACPGRDGHFAQVRGS